MTIFALAGLVGPLLRWATWPPSPPSAGWLGNFVYDLVLLLWPTQPLAVMEASVGTLAGAAISVTANILLFVVIGMLAGALAKTAVRLSLVYLVVCVMIVLVFVWSVGFNFSYLNVIALVVALALYVVPFALIWRLSANRKLA
jgi:hypothetical protein